MNKTYCDKCATEITPESMSKPAQVVIGSGKYAICVTTNLSLMEPERRRDTRINIPDNHDICQNCICDAFKALDTRAKELHPCLPLKDQVIFLNKAEIQSKHSRVRYVEGLIEQLRLTHDGRNSWLMNYGVGDTAKEIRKEERDRIGEAFPDWNEETQSLGTVH